jgi:nucleotide-binding universal stress UspA family protein
VDDFAGSARRMVWIVRSSVQGNETRFAASHKVTRADRRQSTMKILLAVDGSTFSAAATKAIVREHRPQDTEVKVLHVVDIALPIPKLYAAGYREESLTQGEDLLQTTAQELTNAGYSVSRSLQEGDPRTKIIDTAAEWHADLIVVGSHGRRGAFN